MADHDALYHRLFSHPGMVAQLLRDFVADSWLDELDLDSMERINAKFHAETGERREGDVVWRIPMRGGRDAYILMLLEFQSSPERWMALRVMVYVGLLWQHLIREGRIAAGGLLPPVLPIVIYNGDPRWAMPLSLHELIDLSAESPFWPWQPALRYHIIDEGAYPAAELAGRGSLAALLFRLEHCHDPDQIVPLIDAVIGWFGSHPGFEPLKSAFALLAGRLVATEDGNGPPRPEDLLEVRTMLSTRAEEWKRHWQQQGLQAGLQEGRQKGRQEGRQEGLQTGRQEGERTILLRLLERRFGPLPDWVRARLNAAEPVLLEEWGLRLLDASSLEAVFG